MKLFRTSKSFIRVSLLLLSLCFLLAISLNSALASQRQNANELEEENLGAILFSDSVTLSEAVGESPSAKYETGEVMVAPVPDGAVTNSVEEYQAVVDKLNKELGTQIKLPDKGFCETFGFTGLDTTMPLDEFEKQLREDVAKGVEENAKSIAAWENVKNDPSAVTVEIPEFTVELFDMRKSDSDPPNFISVGVPVVP